jgi:hypothetical protein
MENGLIGFTVTGIPTPNSTGMENIITLNFEQLPVGTNYFLNYGLQASQSVVPTWYQSPDFTIIGNQIILKIKDNGSADADPELSVIRSLGGPGIKPVPVLGDINLDGKIDCFDLTIVKAAFGKRTGKVGFDARADVNKDGIVDIRDLSYVSRLLPSWAKC